jgi:hypothetical protein
MFIIKAVRTCSLPFDIVAAHFTMYFGDKVLLIGGKTILSVNNTIAFADSLFVKTREFRRQHSVLLYFLHFTFVPQ